MRHLYNLPDLVDIPYPTTNNTSRNEPMSKTRAIEKNDIVMITDSNTLTRVTYTNKSGTFDTQYADNVKPANLTRVFYIRGYAFTAQRLNTGTLCYQSEITGFENGILNSVDYNHEIAERFDELVDEINASYVATSVQGANSAPEVTILEETEVEINTTGSDIHEQYISIVGNISEINSAMNMETAARDTKELFEAFKSAEASIKGMSSNKIVSEGKSAVGSFVTKYLWANPLGTAYKEHKQESKSVQETINYLFGLVEQKYEKLIVTGESLQASKAQLKAQISALEIISVQSTNELSGYASQADIPIRVLSLDTGIKSSIEKYRARLLKIDGAIVATQTTIIALGKDLPALKTDLTDEMAISTLLNSVDDYQKMYSEIATLVADVTNTAAEQTHKTIENLLQMQIDDTHTIKYIAESGKRAEKFATMIADKTEKVAKKAHRDATFIADIVKGNSIEHARKTIKMIEG